MPDHPSDMDAPLHSPQLLETLAALEHERWSRWQRYLHSRCEARADGALIIPADLVARWEEQITRPYAALTEAEKESDRDQVRSYLPAIAAALRGRSATLFTAAYDPATETGTYVAMESFEGSLDGHEGAFNFAHSATTLGTGREAEFLVIVPGSGTGALAGIHGSGGLALDADGTHRIWFDYGIGEGTSAGLE